MIKKRKLSIQAKARLKDRRRKEARDYRLKRVEAGGRALTKLRNKK